MDAIIGRDEGRRPRCVKELAALGTVRVHVMEGYRGITLVDRVEATFVADVLLGCEGDATPWYVSLLEKDEENDEGEEDVCVKSASCGVGSVVEAMRIGTSNTDIKRMTSNSPKRGLAMVWLLPVQLGTFSGTQAANVLVPT